MTKRKETLTSEEALYFRNEFREARYDALKYAEGYQRILFAVERLGAYLTGKHDGTLYTYEDDLATFIKCHHPLQGKMPDICKDYHTEYKNLLELVRHERNEALHKGALVNVLTSHLIELSIMLEDSIMTTKKSTKTIMANEIQNYMTRNPVRAYSWQPISFIRQQMLENSFSYIPVHMKKSGEDKEDWYIISDYGITTYLRSATEKSCRRKLLSQSLECADKGESDLLEPACVVRPTTTVGDALDCAKGRPILVQSPNCPELLGIATPFDLM